MSSHSLPLVPCILLATDPSPPPPQPRLASPRRSRLTRSKPRLATCASLGTHPSLAQDFRRHTFQSLRRQYSGAVDLGSSEIIAAPGSSPRQRSLLESCTSTSTLTSPFDAASNLHSDGTALLARRLKTLGAQQIKDAGLSAKLGRCPYYLTRFVAQRLQ
ncbi:hypothetical protein B0J12DRAFT_272056 [Macrophomina phaseolina]|uniref:Uncharacterized protein n=1 Tax=Macrophomina phaseolina TaxID=35725 RepID=A0ABQ8FXS6_9PEZI|nr:hypothetical protein B0J12DRAFT_272056 [Macrophomina phaseolina]